MKKNIIFIILSIMILISISLVVSKFSNSSLAFPESSLENIINNDKPPAMHGGKVLNSFKTLTTKKEGYNYTQYVLVLYKEYSKEGKEIEKITGTYTLYKIIRNKISEDCFKVYIDGKYVLSEDGHSDYIIPKDVKERMLNKNIRVELINKINAKANSIAKYYLETKHEL